MDGELAVCGPKYRLLHPGRSTSPLQHTWSLGVEEQYYVVWPLLLIGATLLLAARARRRCRRATVGGVRFAAFLIASLGTMASATAAVAFTSAATRDRIYFGTDTRAQALLIGPRQRLCWCGIGHR